MFRQDLEVLFHRPAQAITIEGGRRMVHLGSFPGSFTVTRPFFVSYLTLSTAQRRATLQASWAMSVRPMRLSPLSMQTRVPGRARPAGRDA